MTARMFLSHATPQPVGSNARNDRSVAEIRTRVPSHSLCKEKSMFKRILTVAAGLFVAAVLLISRHSNALESSSQPANAPTYDVRILRDSWGVPHIFGKTDADVAYGLGYAHAEDDFATMQGALLAARGTLASVYGRKYAANDYMVHLLRVWDVVNSKYETDLSPEVRAICEAYAVGANEYARLHPKAAAPGVLPITGKDIVAGFVHKVPLFFGIDEALEELMGPERKREVSRKSSAQTLLWPSTAGVMTGSNGFAVAPSRSADGKTRLAVNSHQPWDGPVAWYEVHVHSEEGWDMTGGVFPGSPVVFLGHNRDLGWASTVNRPDLIDTYVLDINPDNQNEYRFDGEWRTLEARTAPIKVKLLGPISWTFKREVLWSVYGPVIRQPHGTYAIRFAGMGELRQVEQWYRMNKARTFEEWKNAMRIMAVQMFNFVYADREGNIYYLYNGLIPVRAEGYDWKEYLPGDTSETLWTEYLPLERLPQIENPASGFVISCNNSPFHTTVGPENPKPEDYSPTLGIETRMTNRALRALELFGADDSITAEEFYVYKYDMEYSPQSWVAEYVQKILAAPPSEDPVVREAVEVLRGWDLKTNAENTHAAIGALTIQPFYYAQFRETGPLDLMGRFSEVAHKLKKAHGRIDVPWSEVNRLRRGTIDLGLGGGPDVLRAIDGDEIIDGRVTANSGDCYIIMATWGSDGVTSQSIHQYGSATLNAESPHYADQSPLFAQCLMKPVWLDESEIRAHLEREYRPGEEMSK
ncbi:MAG: acylase [Candidatus Abyssobacteria bacterium SURF_17]|uniref:Acylase n=1 Tax=Candidatus Abyssobacteria bacterium SURF_17 TaxID=2093361 RepID=A0A419ET72_9BACT|nr:MAG: acylase [Candidatus Abyssubacteria bacterium SURF_17]